MSILAATEAQLGTLKVQWADAETEKDIQAMKVNQHRTMIPDWPYRCPLTVASYTLSLPDQVKKFKKMLYKVGLERDQLGRKVANLEVKLAGKR